MSRTEETYIDKPRKFVHDVLTIIGQVFFVLALAALLAALFAGGKISVFIFLILISLFFNHLSTKIKYTWVKTIEVGGYKLV